MGDKNESASSKAYSLLKGSDEFAQEYHMAIVFPLEKSKDGKEYERSQETLSLINKMEKCGLETFCYNTVKESEMICLVKLPEAKMKNFADKTKFEMKLDETKIVEALKNGYTLEGRQIIKSISIPSNEEVTKLRPEEFIYGPYTEELHDLFVPMDGSDPFHPAIQLKLLMNVIEGETKDGGCKIPISSLENDEKIIAYFPLHRHDSKVKLEKNWLGCCVWPWMQPFDEIKEYFGEVVGLYFKFIAHLSSWLYVPGLVGIPLQLVVWETQDFSHPVLPFYGVVVCLWSIYMLEHWKRVEKDTALRWGMLNFEETEPIRPEFKADTIVSFIDGSSNYPYFPKGWRNARQSFSFLVIVALIFMVIGVVAGIYVFRFMLESMKNIGTEAAVVASVLNAVQIAVFNIVYGWLAIKLTNLENHKTDSAYSDSMIVKNFFFQFVNSYSSFFFIAFIAKYLDRPDYLGDDSQDIESQYVGQCGWKDCMKPLSINLAIIYGTRLSVTNITEVLIPYFSFKSAADEDIKNGKPISQAEKESLLTEYDGLMDPINKMTDIAIQYGFMTMFITALPVATFMAIITCMLRIQADGWVICALTQRPVPAGTEDIGSWQSILEFLSMFSVVTNAALICFTMSVLDEYSIVGRVWIFIGFQWVLISSQYLIKWFVNDESTATQIQIQRQQFIVSKLIEKVPDEEEESVDANKPVEPDVVVYEYPFKRDENNEWPKTKAGVEMVKMGVLGKLENAI